LKNGRNASEDEKREAAKMAGIYSKAWALGYTTTKVYCVEKENIIKLPIKGKYNFKGKREWFDVELKAYIGWRKIDGKKFLGIWMSQANIDGEYITIMPGKQSKKDVLSRIKEQLKIDDIDEEYIFGLLPGGGFSIE